MMATKQKVKYLAINLTRNAQDLQEKNFKITQGINKKRLKEKENTLCFRINYILSRCQFSLN